MSDDCSFRFATPNDAAALVVLVNDSYSGPERELGWTPETGLFGGLRTSLEEIHAAIAREDCRILLCETQDGLMGCCQIDSKGQDVYFGLFAVWPRRQASGWGRIILAEAEIAAVRLWNSAAMWMTVVSLQTRLIAYYERRGYVQTGEHHPLPTAELPGVLRNDFDLLVMRKALSRT